MTDRLPVTVTERPGPFQSLEFQMAWGKGGILIKAPPMLPAVIKIPAVTAMTWTAFAILVFFWTYIHNKTKNSYPTRDD